MPLHNRDVQAIAGREQSPILNDFARSQSIRLLNCEDIVHDIQQQLERRPNRFSSAYRGIPVDNLLKHFGAGYEAFVPM